MRSLGKSLSLPRNHSTSGSGYPIAQAVNLAVIPLNTSQSPIFLRNTGSSALGFRSLETWRKKTSEQYVTLEHIAVSEKLYS